MNATDTDPKNVMTFKATDPDTNTYVNIIQFSNLSVAKANVTVRTPLDRESHEGGIELKFSVIDSRGNTVRA
ncbi:hypothetical protein CHS0354_020609 [Potamilus streckersoni]|uniref:Uncharacterized protein n=1 Tax=Potamilus streckersoni TaxID=2493646 RepID=A0AAE0VHA2_9BIVA|nr:hypothetical protein CHS0354_020609 [Potamilus streckersoni]